MNQTSLGILIVAIIIVALAIIGTWFGWLRLAEYIFYFLIGIAVAASYEKLRKKD